MLPRDNPVIMNIIILSSWSKFFSILHDFPLYETFSTMSATVLFCGLFISISEKKEKELTWSAFDPDEYEM